MARFRPPGQGWIPDVPDFRDYTPARPSIRELLGRLPQPDPEGSIDLREYFPPVDHQRGLNSSAAHACLSVIQYSEGRALGARPDPSPLFVYKMARQHVGCSGDCGASIRTTLKCIRRFGAPPETAWPYDVDRYEDKPDPSLFSYARDYCGLRYVRIDARNAMGSDRLAVAKSFVAAHLPVIFGFAVPTSISINPIIPYRPRYDALYGGQCVVAVGYDDELRSAAAGAQSVGALLIRNSWGAEWGDAGYGWLPYQLIADGYAADFWVILKPDWLDSDEFKQPKTLDIAEANGTTPVGERTQPPHKAEKRSSPTRSPRDRRHR